MPIGGPGADRPENDCWPTKVPEYQNTEVQAIQKGVAEVAVQRSFRESGAARPSESRRLFALDPNSKP